MPDDHPTRDGGPDRQSFATERDPRLRLIIPAVVAVAFLMEQLDSTIITTAIPVMIRHTQVRDPGLKALRITSPITRTITATELSKV